MTKRGKHKIQKGLVIFASSVLMAMNLSLMAQEGIQSADTTRKNAIRIFLDCERCDMDYMKREIPYINYVREVRESQVYLLITQQRTGSGGTEYSLFFSGQHEFSGMNDTLKFLTSPDDTRDVIRTGLTNSTAAGLMRYVARTPILSQVKINYTGEENEEPKNVVDKWKY